MDMNDRDSVAAKLLLVDDERKNLDVLIGILEPKGYDIAVALQGETALDLVRQISPDLVLLDVMMPGIDGYETCRRLKSDPATRHIPVIFLTAKIEVADIVKGFEVGAVDYVVKPLRAPELMSRIETHLELKFGREKLETALEELKTIQNQLIIQEKMASLGKLSAGMAHELNNPAAAAQRGVEQLRAVFSQLQSANLKIGNLQLSHMQMEALLGLEELAKERVGQSVEVDALTRSDREYEIENWLQEKGIDNAWEIAPTLVALGYEQSEMAALAENFTNPQLPAVIDWQSATYAIYSLISEIGLGTGRISEIVKALKTYTYMDQAPIQSVDVHEDLDNTLIILRNKLKVGIDVRREYAQDLPCIEAYGGELNQVWTNIIDNAIAAMEGQGQLVLRTREEAPWVVVEIEDNGPGIPEEIHSKIFDPFFTTKPPGSGTGLGLNISHNIIVQKHQGQIAVSSQPGKTCFAVRLPVNSVSAESL